MAALLVATCVLVALGFWGAARPVLEASGGLFAVAALLAELGAVRVGTAGSFSASFAFCLAAVLRSGFPLGFFVLGSAALGRLASSRPLADLFAHLAAIVVAARLLPYSWPAAALSAGLVYLVVRSRFVRGELHDQLLPQVVGLICSGMLLARGDLPALLLLLPVLAGLQLSAQSAVVAGEERHKLALQLELAHQAARADDLTHLLKAFRDLATTLQRSELLQRLPAHIRAVVQATRWAIVLDGRVAAGDPALIPEGVDLTQPTSVGTVLIAPIPEWGALAAERDGNSPRHLNLLYALAMEAGVALTNCRLHEQVSSSQAQLIQSSKLAAVGQLAAGVAHELNTPLGAISLTLEYAQMKTRTQPEVHEKLDVAVRSAEKMQGIIDKLLHYSRVDEGKKTSYEVAAVVRDVLELIGTHLLRQGVKVDTEVRPGLTVVGNVREMQQVLINLVMNARDAVVSLPDNQRRVQIRADRNDEGIFCEVSDAGPGVAPEHRARIFDPFYTTKPQGQGTGLGLSISRELAEKHGARLDLVDASCFRVTWDSP